MGWNRMDIISTIKHFFHELITFKYRKSYLWFINLWYILMSHIFIIFLFGIYFRDLSFLVTHGHLVFSVFTRPNGKTLEICSIIMDQYTIFQAVFILKQKNYSLIKMSSKRYPC